MPAIEEEGKRPSEEEAAFLAKVKNEAAAKVRQFEEYTRVLEQSQIQRLQVRKQYSVPTICMYGLDAFQ